MKYNLEIEKAVETIKKEKAKKVCIQLPDGLKMHADKIQKEIEKKTDAEVFIWMGSCYGACDTPEIKGIDLLIQWGHSEWQ